MLDAISILVKLELIKKHSQYLVIYIYNSNGVTEGVIWHDCTALEKKLAPFIGIYIKNCLKKSFLYGINGGASLRSFDQRLLNYPLVVPYSQCYHIGTNVNY